MSTPEPEVASVLERYVTWWGLGGNVGIVNPTVPYCVNGVMAA